MTNKKPTYDQEKASSTVHIKVKPSAKAYYVNQANKARMNLTQWITQKLGYWPED